MNPAAASLLPSAVALGVVFAAALPIAARRPIGPAAWSEMRRLLLIACTLHAVHLTEETLFEFHRHFPALFGQPAMPLPVFLGFNLALLGIWLVGAWRRSPGVVVTAFFWFLGLASALNGVIHPALALRVEGYFPGLITSPMVGIMGIVLVRGLWRAADPQPTSDATDC